MHTLKEREKNKQKKRECTSLTPANTQLYTVSQKSDAKIQITITMAYLTRIKYPLRGFNYHPFYVNIANFNNIYRTVSEQQLF